MTVLRPLLFFGALALAWGCRRTDPGPTTGSETHFLSWCSSSESCGEGLECVCGVCSKSCSDASSCAELAPTAECLALDSRPADESCEDTPVEMACEVRCTLDADCVGLGNAHRCDRGLCRQPAHDCETGGVSGGEVVVLGDSFLGDSHAITAELETLARNAGALDEAESYRDYSSTVVTPFGGMADLATQYTAAQQEGAVRIVIMDVGGPDALLSCPDPPTQACPSLMNAIDGADELWRQMADDGVEAVVDFFYPDPEDASLKAKFDVLQPLMHAECERSPASCHFLDLHPTFDGHEDEYLLPGGINPTEEGSAATAAAIWSLMQRSCIAQ